LRKTGHL